MKERDQQTDRQTKTDMQTDRQTDSDVRGRDTDEGDKVKKRKTWKREKKKETSESFSKRINSLQYV